MARRASLPNANPKRRKNSCGNPGAYIYRTANDLYAIWIDDGNALALYGNMNGLSMAVDTKIQGAAQGLAQFYVGKEGSYYVSSDWDISLDTEWMHHSAPLTSEFFLAWGSPSLSLSQVIEAPDDIGIFFGASTVTADPSSEILIDNFGTAPVPEPDSAIPFVFCTSLLLFLQRRRQCRPLSRKLQGSGLRITRKI